MDDLPQMLRVMDMSLDGVSDESGFAKRFEIWKPRFDDPDMAFSVATVAVHEEEGTDEAGRGELVVGWSRVSKHQPNYRKSIGVDEDDKFSDERDPPQLMNLFVLPGYQRRGIGRVLFWLAYEAAVDRLQAQRMLVWSTKAGRDFYKAMGGQERETFEGTDNCGVAYESTAFLWVFTPKNK